MQPIIVIGMHRSGTSLITSVLKKMGVFMGSAIDDNNEAVFFANFNKWIFSQAGATWDNPFNFRFVNEDFKNEIIKSLVRYLSSVKRVQYLGSGKRYLEYRSLVDIDFPWGWKDPVNTFTLDLYKVLFPDARIINVYRNPIDVAVSLQTRELKAIKLRGTKTRTGIRKFYNEFTLSEKRIYVQSLRVMNVLEGIKLWECYVEKALSFDSGDKNYYAVCYEDFLTEPERVLNELAGFTQMKISKELTDNILSDINTGRKFAFADNSDLCKIYEGIKNKPLLKQLGYDKILSKE